MAPQESRLPTEPALMRIILPHLKSESEGQSPGTPGSVVRAYLSAAAAAAAAKSRPAARRRRQQRIAQLNQAWFAGLDLRDASEMLPCFFKLWAMFSSL